MFSNQTNPTVIYLSIYPNSAFFFLLLFHISQGRTITTTLHLLHFFHFLLFPNPNSIQSCLLLMVILIQNHHAPHHLRILPLPQLRRFPPQTFSLFLLGGVLHHLRLRPNPNLNITVVLYASWMASGCVRLINGAVVVVVPAIWDRT